MARGGSCLPGDPRPSGGNAVEIINRKLVDTQYRPVRPVNRWGPHSSVGVPRRRRREVVDGPRSGRSADPEKAGMGRAGRRVLEGHQVSPISQFRPSQVVGD